MRIEMLEGSDDFLESCWGGAHHMGATRRMDEDPARGVTNGNAKVHHTHNLYVAGSSLFSNVRLVQSDADYCSDFDPAR